MFTATILTIFPEMFPGPLGCSLAGKALRDGLWALNTLDIRDFASDKHRTVDDKPFGGGNGMVMRADVLGAAIESAIETAINRQITRKPRAKLPQTARKTPANRPQNSPKLLYMSPRGTPFGQSQAIELSKESDVIILCGRFEGIDERVIEYYEENQGLTEVSMGDFVLSGGEIAAMAIIDACVRLIPGVLKNENTLREESFGGRNVDSSFGPELLEYPHYTRPAEWKGRTVPSVLLSGNHGEIERWRQLKAEELTKARRADLWNKYCENR